MAECKFHDFHLAHRPFWFVRTVPRLSLGLGILALRKHIFDQRLKVLQELN